MKDFGTLGKDYSDGEVIVKQGDPAEEFYVLQEGRLEIFQSVDGKTIPLAVCSQGEIIGEWMPDEGNFHAASVRAVGKSRVITVHRQHLMKRIHEDPTLAFRVLEMMSRRLHEVSRRLVEAQTNGSEN